MTPQEISSLITELAKEIGLTHFGFAQLSRPLTFEFYKQWLEQGYQGEMGYLEKHAEVKEKPQSEWPRAKSALVFGIPYLPHPESDVTLPIKQARLSLYAQGADYHIWFKQRMAKICQKLAEVFPKEEFLTFTDSHPVLERDLAYRSGLGWFGKNTCLIHPKKGSLFFIGEIYTSLDIDARIEPLPDFCGKCTKCIDVCPTKALIEPRKLDARKCISYLTIESKKIPAPDLLSKMGDWFFGCDLCQTVCPWNQKVFKGQLSIAPQLSLTEKDAHALVEDLRYILSTSGKQLSRAFDGTPLARAGAFGLKRNALIVIGNRKIQALREEVLNLGNHPRLGELVNWTLAQLNQEP